MYLRECHAERDIPTLRQFLRDNPLGILTTAIPSPDYPLLQCSHIPWVIDVVDDQDSQELPKLRGHMARQNPHSKAMIDLVKSSPSFVQASSSGGPYKLDGEVMILFNGPVHHYVTPKFYVETKPATGKVAPTWNYSAVQCYGTALVYIDSAAESTAEFLGRVLNDLSDRSETNIMHFSTPWKVSDAPEQYIELLKKAIIGIEVQVSRIEGKFKMSQESSAGDRVGIIAGFEAMGTDVGTTMAGTVRERSA